MVGWREGFKIYIHIGNGISVIESDIIMILDRKSLFLSQDNMDFINRLIDNKKVLNKIDDEIKSYILVKDQRSKAIDLNLYVSNISSMSLMKRA